MSVPQPRHQHRLLGQLRKALPGLQSPLHSALIEEALARTLRKVHGSVCHGLVNVPARCSHLPPLASSQKVCGAMRDAAGHPLACDESVVGHAVDELNSWFGGGRATWKRWRTQLFPELEARFPGILHACFVR